MRSILKTDHLTDPGGVNHLARRTQPGMAHFSGEGPDGARCWFCKFLNFKGLKKDNLPKVADCQKGTGVKFYPDAAACKYYEPAPRLEQRRPKKNSA